MMGFNLKEEWQKANKKNVAIIVCVILVLILGIFGGIYGYHSYVVKKEKEAQAARMESYESMPMDLSEEPKKPSEYNIGIDYKQAIKQKKPILTLFYADWCGYCIRFMPIYQKLSEKYGESMNFSKVNVEDEKYKELVEEMRLTGFPTVIIIDPKFDNRVSIPNSFIGSLDDVSIEIDRFLKIRKILDSKK
ncbi:MAG: thioredoxin domain-containing protein [Muribaculaceae bacterium]|nr:thioredoxin domain-containing protein [Muribaculaceae bacterium]